MKVVNFPLHFLVPQLGLPFHLALPNHLNVGENIALVGVEEAEFFVADAAAVVVVDHSEDFLEVIDGQHDPLLLAALHKLLQVQLTI